MNRRQFIKVLTVLGGAGLSLSASSSLAGWTNPPLPPTSRTSSSTQTWPERKGGRIGIVAIGGAGCSTLRSLHHQLPYLSQTVAIDTNPFTLYRTQADHYIWLGNTADKAIDPNTARFYAKASKSEIREALQDFDVAILILGLGGAAGSGIAPIVSEVAREDGILTIAAPITPFDFEGLRRKQIGRTALGAIARRTDATIELPNEQFAVGADDEAFPVVLDRVSATFQEIYLNIASMVSESGLGGVDFEDFKTLLRNSRQLGAFGYGQVPVGESTCSAVNSILYSRLLGREHLSVPTKAIISIRGNSVCLTAKAIQEISSSISSYLTNIQKLYGTLIDDSMGDELVVSVLAV